MANLDKPHKIHRTCFPIKHALIHAILANIVIIVAFLLRL